VGHASRPRYHQRLDRVEQGLLDLGKFMRQIARDQARVSKLEKRRGS
jgi:hypothetical protein